MAGNDAVNHPAHYTQGRFEVIDVICDSLTPEAWEGYCVGNVLKYVMRYRHKGGVEDLRKARWYLDRLIGGLVPDGEHDGGDAEGGLAEAGQRPEQEVALRDAGLFRA